MRALLRMIGLLPLVLAPSSARADEVLDALSARSRIPVAQLQELLADCERTQRAMNICAFHSAVEADLDLQHLIESNAAQMTGSQADAYRADIAHWRSDTELSCQREADAQAAGGTMRPMVYSFCMTDALQDRAAFEAGRD